MESDHVDWTVARDQALVLYVDTLCRAWSTTPSRLMPDELLLSEVDFANEDFHHLQGEVSSHASFMIKVCLSWSRLVGVNRVPNELLGEDRQRLTYVFVFRRSINPQPPQSICLPKVPKFRCRASPVTRD